MLVDVSCQNCRLIKNLNLNQFIDRGVRRDLFVTMQLREHILHALKIKSDQTSEDLINGYVTETEPASWELLSVRTAVVEAISKLVIEQKIYKKFSQCEKSFGQTIYYLNGNLQAQAFGPSLANLELRQVVILVLAELLRKFQDKCLRIQVINLAFLCYTLSSKGSCYKQLNILGEKGFIDIIAKLNGTIKLSYPIGTGLSFLKQTQPVEYARIITIAKKEIGFEDRDLAELIQLPTNESSSEKTETNTEVVEDLISEANAKEAIDQFFSEYGTLLKHVLELKAENSQFANQLQVIQSQVVSIKETSELEQVAVCRSAVYNFSKDKNENQNIRASWVYNLSLKNLIELDFNCPNLLLSIASYHQVARDLELEIEEEISTEAYLNDSSVEVFYQIKCKTKQKK